MFSLCYISDISGYLLFPIDDFAKDDGSYITLGISPNWLDADFPLQVVCGVDVRLAFRNLSIANCQTEIEN